MPYEHLMLLRKAICHLTMRIIANTCDRSQTNYTLTHLAEHLQKFSQDPINRYLRN
jgi:response regulator of citrate/malate metabolism